MRTMSKSANVTIRLNSTVIAMMLRIIGSVTKNSFCDRVGAVDRRRLIQLLGHRLQRRQIHDHEERRAEPDIDRDGAEPRDPAHAEPRHDWRSRTGSGSS